MADLNKVKQLRQETGVGIVACKEALEKAHYDLNEAKIVLRKGSGEVAENLSNRNATEGIIVTYTHHNSKVGSIVEIHCETDFGAATLKDFGHEVAMQVAASNPEFISFEDVSEERIAQERAYFISQSINSICPPELEYAGESDEIVNKMVVGKFKKFRLEHCLLNQRTIKDSGVSVRDLLNDQVQRLGEKIEIAKFARFQIS